MRRSQALLVGISQDRFCRKPSGGLACWQQGVSCAGALAHVVLGAVAQHRHKQVLLQGKVGAAGEADAALSAFRWDAGRPCKCTVLEPGVSLQPSLSAGCQAGPQSLAPLLVPDCFPSFPDLYRRAMLALKMRQEQRKQQSAIVP